jgi:hypothetical protein
MPGLGAKVEEAMAKLPVMNGPSRWEISCNEVQFEECRRDPKFTYLVALARALNALNSSHSLLLLHSTGDSPEEVRSLMNSYFFSSALLYEAIRLIKSMKKPFRNNLIFQDGLMRLLRDPAARKIEQMYLNPARNHAVFHFLPDEFKGAIEKQPTHSCVFLAGKGTKRGEMHYSYADIVAGEMMIGIPSHQEQFFDTLQAAAGEISKLIGMFADDAQKLILAHLYSWGFRKS